MNTVTLGWPLAVPVIVLTAAAAAATRLAGLGSAGHVVVAATRAVVQLAAMSLVIGLVLRSLALTALLTLMVVIAAGASAHRITGSLRPRSWWTAAPILAGIVPTMAAVLLSTPDADRAGREAAGLALIPGLDQARTVGLVTLPGAFVGVRLAGASPLQAGAVQPVVLVGLLLAVSVTIELVSAGLRPIGAGPLDE